MCARALTISLLPIFGESNDRRIEMADFLPNIIGCKRFQKRVYTFKMCPIKTTLTTAH